MLELVGLMNSSEDLPGISFLNFDSVNNITNKHFACHFLGDFYL